MDLKKIKSSLFPISSAFEQPDIKPPPPPPRTVVAVNRKEAAINLLESARLELSEKSYTDSPEMALTYLEEALDLLR